MPTCVQPGTSMKAITDRDAQHLSQADKAVL
jgi:hypothetical protein